MNKIQPIAVERSEDGWWTHPDMPVIETSEQFDEWQKQQGFQLCIVMLDGDAGDGTEEAYKTYFDAAAFFKIVCKLVKDSARLTGTPTTSQKYDTL